MAETIHGARLWNTPSEAVVNHAALFIGSNSTVYSKGDVVAQEGGQLVLKGATSSPGIVGVVLRTQTMSDTNITVAKVYPRYIDVTQKELSFLMGCNTDMTAISSVGLTFAIHSDGTTAIQQVDTSVVLGSGLTDAEVICLEVDPQAEGGSGSGSGLRQGVFRFVKLFGKTYNSVLT